MIQTKALELQSSIIANALKHSIKETRNNITKMFHKSFDMTMGHAEEEQNAANENDRTEIDYKKLQNSPLAAGLPIMSGKKTN